MESAQDFGEMIYYVLKQILTDCYFMVSGTYESTSRTAFDCG
ncbi:hypothetical protein ACTNBF_07985 [Bariatricus sp. HCP28S3_A4]